MMSVGRQQGFAIKDLQQRHQALSLSLVRVISPPIYLQAFSKLPFGTTEAVVISPVFNIESMKNS